MVEPQASKKSNHQNIQQRVDKTGAKKVLYLYGLALSKDLKQLDGLGIDGCSPLFLNPVGEITAVLTHAVLDDFIGERGDENLQDINWITPRACRHQEVVEQIMAQSPVLPVRFGTLYHSKESLNQMLGQHETKMALFLKDIANKEEWAVKGYMDRNKAVMAMTQKLMGQASESLDCSSNKQDRGFRVGESDTPGALYFKKKKIEQQAQAELNQYVHELVISLADRLEPLSVDMTERQLRSKKVTGKDTDMILNWAALLDKNNIQPFNAAINRINDDYQTQGVKLESSGPWPPYSFCPEWGMEDDQ